MKSTAAWRGLPQSISNAGKCTVCHFIMAFAISTDQQAEEVRNQKRNITTSCISRWSSSADTLLLSFFSNKFSGRLEFACIPLPWKLRPFGAQPQLIFIVHQNGRRGGCQADENALLFKFRVLKDYVSLDRRLKINFSKVD